MHVITPPNGTPSVVSPQSGSSSEPDRFASVRTYFGRLKPGLSLKLVLIVVVISLIGILASSFLLLRSLQEQFIEQAQSSNMRLNLTLRASLEHAMLTHDSAMLNTVVQQAASDLSGERIRIFDQNSIVRSSSSPTEVGMLLDSNAPECQNCHPGDTSQSITEATMLHPDGNGAQALLTVSPIANKPACTSCHDAQTETLGILMIQAPLTDLNRQMQEGFWRVALGALVTFVLLVGLMVPTLHKFITAPVGELSKGVSEIGAENLEYRVPVNSHDELGQLAEAFNVMQQHLKASRLEMEQRNQELAVLYDVALTTGQLLELKPILDHALHTVVSQLALEVGHIYLWDSAKNRFESASSLGMSSEQLQLIDQKRREPSGDLTRDVARTGEVFFEPDVSRNDDFVRMHCAGLWENLHRRSYVNVPLKSQGKVVGTLELLGHAEQPLTERQVEILKAVGTQIGIAIDNTSLLIETQRNAREALTLYQLGTKVSSSLELDEVLDAVAKGACEALASDIGVVGLSDADHQELVLKAIAGAQAEQWRGLRIPIEEASAFVLTEPVNLEELPAALPAPLAQLFGAEQIKSLLVVPLLRGEQPHGIVAVLMRARRAFSEEEIRLLTCLAQQVVTAIENARLYQQVRYLAALEERDRLAREMHDNLAQALGYLNLKAGIISDLLSSGATEQARTSLLEMKQIIREAYTDTREAIFNLRNTVSSGRDLMPMLREYLAEYRVHYGLDTRLVVDDMTVIEFSTDVAVQLSRIIQEGLTNIRKHARATRAWVHFDREGEQACIVVEDNGQGFDLTATPADDEAHFGLQIMRERAASVGGTVELDPQIGRGTRVVVHVPIQPRSEARHG